VTEARDRLPAAAAAFAARGLELHAVSAATGQGMTAVMHAVLALLERTRAAAAGEARGGDGALDLQASP
jgi:hypothetical protein